MFREPKPPKIWILNKKVHINHKGLPKYYESMLTNWDSNKFGEYKPFINGRKIRYWAVVSGTVGDQDALYAPIFYSRRHRGRRR